MIHFIGKRRSMQLRPRLEKGQASDGVLRLPCAVLHADIKVLLRGLADFGTDAAARVEVAAGKAHERAHGECWALKLMFPEKGKSSRNTIVPWTPFGKRLLDWQLF